jgi:Spy/CpxP family protein refolding chaperone
MKTKVLKLILAASLALNLAFVSTILYQKITDRSPNKKTALEQEQKRRDEMMLKTHFNLKAEQKQEIKKIIREFKINLMKYKQDILDNRIAIIEALGETEFNVEDIESKTKLLNRLESELNLLFVESLMRINALLEPEQRLSFLYEIGRNWFFIAKKHKPTPGEGAFQNGGNHD